MTGAAHPAIAWPEARTATTHLGAIEYHDVGQGPVIVFVHLLLADATHWDKMVPLLAERFRCIMPTLPMGAHRLPTNEGSDLSIPGLARAIHQLLEQLGLTDVTLVGNDTGGAIAQVMAAEFPERLGRVVLTNSDMYDAFPPKMFAYFKLLPYIPGSMWVAGHSLKIRALWPLPFVFGALTNKVDATKINRWTDALLANKLVRRDARRLIKTASADITNRAAEMLKTTKLPFLLAWGANDKAFKPALAQRFCTEVSTANLVLIDDCKTLVCWDRPDRLAELITNFIEPQ
jgi:pimeloyl-ACP methyl ester carboxylesterase